MDGSLGRRQFLSSSLALGASATVWHAVADDQPNRKKIRVGQIGTGHAHASKLSVYRKSPDYEVVGIVEPDEKLRQKASNQAVYQDLQWMTTEQLLNASDLDAVLVETEVRDLLTTADTCISAGKHVHLDKPAGESFLQYTRLLEAAAKKNLMVQMGYMYRYNPAVVMLREFLEKGWLGDPFETHTVMSKVVPAGSRLSLSEYPGGMMFELGCHIMDLTIGVLGAPEKVHAFTQHASSLNDRLKDNMLATLEYPRALATVKTSALEVDGFARRHFVVCGTEGTFHIQPLDAPTVRFSLSQPRDSYPKGMQEVKFGGYSRYVGDAADMAKVIRGEMEVDFSYEHDLTVQRCVLEACGLPIDS